MMLMPESVAEPANNNGKTGARVLLVTTCWWPALARLAHFLVDAGCAVGIICPAGHPARLVAGVEVFEQSAFRPLIALSGAILRFDPVFIVPGDERALRHLHRLHTTGSAKERALVERSLGPPERYPVTTSRIELLTMAARLGVAVPAGAQIAGAAALDAWMAGVAAPFVL
jgi:hypothetical protein